MNRISFTVGFSVFFIFSLLARASDAAPGGILMGALGDSITAAMFADQPVPGAQPLSGLPGANSGPHIDKIIENKDTLSWASGTTVNSHFVKLGAYLRAHGETRPLSVFNTAIPDVKSISLPTQAQRLYEEFNSGQYSELKYVTILIGANDACHSDGVPQDTGSTVYSNLMQAIRTIAQIKQSEKIHILLVGIPRIPDLAAPAIKNAMTFHNMTCGHFRDEILRRCRFMVNWQSNDEYLSRIAVVTSINEAAMKAAKDSAALYPNLDFAYSNRFFEAQIQSQLLAVDCFHPNGWGQQALSDETWPDQPWFK